MFDIYNSLLIFILYLGIPNTALKALQSLAKHPELASTLLAAVSVSHCPYISCHCTHPPVAETSSSIHPQHHTTRERHSNTGGHDMLESKGM